MGTPDSKVEAHAYEHQGRAHEALRIRLLGGFRVSVGARIIREEEWRLKKAASLIKLLALAPGHRVHREQLMDLLWPNFGKGAAANNLRRTLYVARRTLDPSPVPASRLLASAGEQIVLCQDEGVWVDVGAFEEATREARQTKETSSYRAAIDLYAGELLPEDRYGEWAEVPRERLRGLFFSLLSELAGLYEERGNLGSAINMLERLLAEEPTSEGANASLMRLYALWGRREEALAQYERLRTALSRKLGAAPSAPVRTLREEIVAGRYPPSAEHRVLPSEQLVRAPRHNLPTSRTSFVNRERELMGVKKDMATVRLLTLTGMGGTGKTRLAVEVARDLAGAYPDGGWLVELASLSRPHLVPQKVAETLGVREQPDRPLEATLTDALCEKELLLILDNCEHLLGACAHLVDTLLDACPRLQVLATSREPLGVVGEAIRPVPPLTIPDVDDTTDVGELARSGAVRLFIDRARLRLPAFDLHPDNAQAVAQMCRRLGGIPLAIELATARLSTVAVEQLAQRLEGSLGLLDAGPRTADPRQQTMRATLEWSYELLDEPERELFGRLSVFAGSWELEAAEVVGSGDGLEEGDVLVVLSRLVDKSLIVAETSRGGGMRYRMLEPVRQYAREKLEESGHAQAVRRTHALWYLELVAKTGQDLTGLEQEEWLRQLRTEHDNLRAALLWSLGDDGEAEVGLALGAALWIFWHTHGHLREGRSWLERALSRSCPRVSSRRARALYGSGYMALFQGDHQTAEAFLRESITLYRILDNKEGIASCLHSLGFVAMLGQRNLKDVPVLLEEAMRLKADLENKRTIAHILIFEGLVAAGRGEFEKSVTLYEEGLAIFREAGDAQGTCMCLIDLGMLALIHKDYKRALGRLRENLRLAQRCDDKLALHHSLFGFGCVAADQKEYVRAARLWGASEAIHEGAGIDLSPLMASVTDYHGRRMAACSTLGEENFVGAWAEGKGMGQDAAIEYALAAEEVASTFASRQERPFGSPIASLTCREQQIAELVAEGFINRRIAEELHLSERTVATHVSRVLKKLGVRSRNQIANRIT